MAGNAIAMVNTNVQAALSNLITWSRMASCLPLLSLICAHTEEFKPVQATETRSHWQIECLRIAAQ